MKVLGGTTFALGAILVSLGLGFVSTGDGYATSGREWAPPAKGQKATDDVFLEPGQKPKCVWKNGRDEYAISEAQAKVAKYIVEQATPNKVGKQGAIVAMLAAQVESDIGINTVNDAGGWYGIFQMTPNAHWGTKAQVMNMEYAVERFYTELKSIKGWREMKHGVAAQAVERSANPDRYLEKKRNERAAIIVDVFITGNVDLKDVECVAEAQPVPSGGAGVDAAMKWALTMIGNPYVFGGNGPTGWDCSSFVREALKRGGAGNVNTMPRTADAQMRWCKAGNCAPVTDGGQAGDLIFWDSYLGPKEIGHVVMVHDPIKKVTIEAHRTCRSGMKGAGKDCGIGNFSYANKAENKELYSMWRPKWSGAGVNKAKQKASAKPKPAVKPKARPATAAAAASRLG